MNTIRGGAMPPVMVRPALGERLSPIVSHCDPTVLLFPKFVMYSRRRVGGALAPEQFLRRPRRELTAIGISGRTAMKTVAIFTILLGFALDVRAADPASLTVHVGDGTLDGRVLEAYDNVWAVNVRYRDGRRDERGLSSDHVRLREIDGKRYLTRLEGTTSVIGKPGATASVEFSMTFNVFDPSTMAPLYGSEASSGSGEERHEFAGRHVTTTSRARASGETRATIELAEPVYDFYGGMTGLLLVALPLKIGYKAVLPALGERGFDTAEIRVVGQEQVSAGHLGTRNTFVVEIGPAPARSVYWISEKAPYVIKAEVRAADAVASWDML